MEAQADRSSLYSLSRLASSVVPLFLPSYFDDSSPSSLFVHYVIVVEERWEAEEQVERGERTTTAKEIGGRGERNEI